MNTALKRATVYFDPSMPGLRHKAPETSARFLICK